MAHDQLRFDLVDRVHGHADHDQQRRSAEIEGHVQAIEDPVGQLVKEIPAQPPRQVMEMQAHDHPLRNQRDQNQVQATDKGDPGKDLIDVIAGAMSGAYAGNKSPVLAHVVSNIGRIENNRNVKVRKEDDAYRVQQGVERLAPLELVQRAAKVALNESSLSHTHSKHLRNAQQRGGKDYRHHTAGVNAQRQVRGLSAHDSPAHNTLGVLHRDAPLSAFHEHDEGDYDDHQHDQEDDGDRSKTAPGAGLDFVPQLGNSSRQSHDDAGKDQQRHAVAYTALRDLFAQPHDEDAAGGERDDSHQNERYARIEHVTLALKCRGNSQALQCRQDKGEIARPLRDLPASQFALFLQAREWLIYHGEQLQNDGSRDVRHDAEGKDCQTAKIAAAEQIVKPQQASGLALECFPQRLGINTRRMNMRTQTVDRQHRQREENTLAKVRNAENIG